MCSGSMISVKIEEDISALAEQPLDTASAASRFVVDSKKTRFNVGNTRRFQRVNTKDSINRGVSPNKDKKI